MSVIIMPDNVVVALSRNHTETVYHNVIVISNVISYALVVVEELIARYKLFFDGILHDNSE